MVKSFVVAAALALPQATGAPLPSTYIPAAMVEATAQEAIANDVTDTAIRTVDAGGHNVGVGVVQRAAGTNLPGGAVHTQVTEVYHVIRGSGLLVTGGTLVNPEQRDSGMPVVTGINGPGVSGTAIEGGVRQQISAGDVVIIPAGTPHWFPEIQEDIVYTVVRVDPGQVVALK